MLSPNKEREEGLLNAGTKRGMGSDLAGAPRPAAAAHEPQAAENCSSPEAARRYSPGQEPPQPHSGVGTLQQQVCPCFPGAGGTGCPSGLGSQPPVWEQGREAAGQQVSEGWDGPGPGPWAAQGASGEVMALPPWSRGLGEPRQLCRSRRQLRGFGKALAYSEPLEPPAVTHRCCFHEVCGKTCNEAGAGYKTSMTVCTGSRGLF